jgi:predicted nucleic acid-binding protein
VNAYQILDTQIIAYAMKNRWPKGIEPQDISCGAISSVTVQELLEVRLPSAANRPRYYLYKPLAPELVGDDETLDRYDQEHKRFAMSAKRHTDQVIFDFGGDYPTVVEYGHLMVGWLLKHKRLDVYARRVGHLEKQERRRLMAIFSYLLASNLPCLSLDRATAQTGIALLRRYATLRGSSLKANIHNSLNDMLILAASTNSGMSLVTEDRALSRFAAEELDVPVVSRGGLVRLGVASESAKSELRRESKEYINRPWQAHIRNRSARLT